MALKALIATPSESAAAKLEKFSRERVKRMRRAWENDGKKPLSPWRFRLQEAELFQREIEDLVAKLTSTPTLHPQRET